MYLSPTDILTHLNLEIIDEVQDGNTGAIDAAIDAAISEATGYLSNYDVATIFAATGAARNAILLTYVKDIAIWHYIQLANPNIDMELREKRYNRAIDWLEAVQAGKIVPPLPPKPATTNNPTPGKIQFGSNAKRNTHY